MKHAPSRLRSGYSLLELVIVMAIFGLIMSSLAFSFIACIRLFNVTMSEAELALRTRELRDKLLFHSQATVPGSFYSGLLSGTNVTASTTSIQMDTESTQLGRRPAQHININVQGETGKKRFVNTEDPNTNPWLIPGQFYLPDLSATEDGTVDRVTITKEKNRIVRLELVLKLRHEINRDLTISHTEHVFVPIFQECQPKWQGRRDLP